MKSLIPRLERRIAGYLSHRPKLYALVVGIGVVLFWRGVWHIADQLHNHWNNNYNYLTINATVSPWWDGPLSLLVGIIILYFTGSFISSFIGNELILSGLRGEKRLTQKTEMELQTEVRAIADIKDSLSVVEERIRQLETKVIDHHKK